MWNRFLVKSFSVRTAASNNFDSLLEYSPTLLNTVTDIQKPSCLSTEATVYCSNSHAYVFLWPVIKIMVISVSRVGIMPRECNLIAVGRILPRIITGEENNLLVARISQNNPVHVCGVSCSNWNNLVMFTQYANCNISPIAVIRRAIT